MWFWSHLVCGVCFVEWEMFQPSVNCLTAVEWLVDGVALSALLSAHHSLDLFPGCVLCILHSSLDCLHSSALVAKVPAAFVNVSKKL